MNTTCKICGNVSIESPVSDVIVVKSFTMKNKQKSLEWAHIKKKTELEGDPETLSFVSMKLFYLSQPQGPAG